MGNMKSEWLNRAIENDYQHAYPGKLKIFFGYAAGVGKTFAMLEAAQKAQKQGMDVVIGYVEAHDRPATSSLVDGIEVLPIKYYQQNNICVKEFDLDAALTRMPTLIIVDELAHTNAKGTRHEKRYQDIEELLRAGIDVYTTVNVQHIESLHDKVSAITGISVKERIPDYVFDKANQVELVDVEPEELIERLRLGLIYPMKNVTHALNNFFTRENLNALREIALRRQADRVNTITDNDRIRNSGNYAVDEHILVCLSASATNAKIVRTAARMSAAFKATFTALFVETSMYADMEEDERKRLDANIRLAEQLGANIERVYGDDVAEQIAEFSRIFGISKIVLGRHRSQGMLFRKKQNLVDQLTDIAPNIDIYVIADKEVFPHNKPYWDIKRLHTFTFVDSAKSLFILMIASLIGYLFYNWNFTEANIVTVYILAVLIISIVTQTRIYSLVSSIFSVLIFNYLFTFPRFTFSATDKGYPITFLIMFFSAFITGTLATKLKSQAKKSAEGAYRTKILLETNQLLQKEQSSRQILQTTGQQLYKLLNRTIVIYPVNQKIEEPFIIPETHDDKTYLLNQNERTVAEWVRINNKHAGATTGTLDGAVCLYLSIRVMDKVYGVVAIEIGEQAIEPYEKGIILSILGEAALALENNLSWQQKQEALILAQNEQLRANLLRAISHDLRSPLTTISGNASNLLYNSHAFDDSMRQQIYEDIYDDSMWLINLIENLLFITRIEEGKMTLNLATESVNEVIDEALKHIKRQRKNFNLQVIEEDDFILAKMDAKLIVQVIINILDNAQKYTPTESTIIIRVKRQEGRVMIAVEDQGPGIPDNIKDKIFDMFYTASDKMVDSQRSLGLGLFLCKAIITAHGGQIQVEDNHPTGSVFSFSLIDGGVNIHE